LQAWLGLACAPLLSIDASYVSLKLDHGLVGGGAQRIRAPTPLSSSTW
jgi:hypothetical protein